MKKAILYARVSSDEQAREGKTSLKTQVKACRDYAEKNGLDIPDETFVVTDDFTGTVPIESRPNGKTAYQMLLDGRADVLVAYRMDRLTRPPEEGDEWDIPVLIRGLAKLGKEIHLVNRGRIGTTFVELLMATFDAKGGGDERRTDLERMRIGHLEKAKSGRVPGKGRRLFGYYYGDGTYNIDKVESPIIQQIFDWYVNGRDGEKMSLRAIALYLTQHGVQTARDRDGAKRPKRQYGLWYLSNVRRLLQHPAYKGEWHYHDGLSGETVIVPIPPIVDVRTWKRAQTLLKLNKEYAARHSTPGRYILRGMIHCATCHKTFIGRIESDHLYYRPNCSADAPYPASHEHEIVARVIEEAAWDYVLHLILSDDLENILADLAGNSDKLEGEYQAKIAQVNADLAAVEAEAVNLVEAIAQVGGAVGDALHKRIEATNEKSTKLLQQREELEQGRPSFVADDVAAYLELRRKLAQGIENATQETKRRRFEEIELYVNVKDGYATITSLFPGIVMSNVNLHPHD